MDADARDGPPAAAGDPAARADAGPLRERRREAASAFEPLYAGRWLSGLVESVVLDGERHFLSPGVRQAVTARIGAFLSAAAVDGTPPGGPDGSL